MEERRIQAEKIKRGYCPGLTLFGKGHFFTLDDKVFRGTTPGLFQDESGEVIEVTKYQFIDKNNYPMRTPNFQMREIMAIPLMCNYSKISGIVKQAPGFVTVVPGIKVYYGLKDNDNHVFLSYDQFFWFRNHNSGLIVEYIVTTPKGAIRREGIVNAILPPN